MPRLISEVFAIKKSLGYPQKRRRLKKYLGSKDSIVGADGKKRSSVDFEE
jgi:hypothetical protein